MQHDWPVVPATVVSASLDATRVPGVCEERLTYRYECFGRAFERHQRRLVAASRNSVQSFVLPAATRPAPASVIPVHYDPKAPALSVHEPALLQFHVLKAIFTRAPVHPLQAARLPDPPADAKPA